LHEIPGRRHPAYRMQSVLPIAVTVSQANSRYTFLCGEIYCAVRSVTCNDKYGYDDDDDDDDSMFLDYGTGDEKCRCPQLGHDGQGVVCKTLQMPRAPVKRRR
jgi:hypothetical protein